MTMTVPEGSYPSQQAAIELVHTELLSYIAQPKTKVVNIVGGAGAGKSWTTINGILPTLLNTLSEHNLRHFALEMTTTTHQANTVIMDELLKVKLPISVSTIHSAMGIIPWTGSCASNPKQFINCGYKLNRNPSLSYGVVLVDEAFRIDPSLWAIMQYLCPNVMWLCIYDAYQTPPVGHSSSPIDDLDAPKAILTESPRFINSGALAQLVTAMRKTVSEQQSDYMDTFHSFAGIAYTTVDRKEYGAVIRNAINTDTPLPLEHLMVCGTRKAACNYNNAIHKLRIQADKPIFHDSDPILLEGVIGAQEPHVAVLIRQGRTWLPEAKPYTAVAGSDLAGILKRFPYVYRYAETNTFIIPTFSSTDTLPYKLWKACIAENVILVMVRLNYTRTIHTAQGMTVPNVYIDLPSISAWSNHDMRRRLLYTGASRSSLNLKVIQ